MITAGIPTLIKFEVSPCLQNNATSHVHVCSKDLEIKRQIKATYGGFLFVYAFIANRL